MIKVEDGRGSNSSSLRKKNIKIVEEFFKKNPGSTIAACSRSTGLSTVTISKHIKTLLGR